jgi:4-aminobutyrate aminotransferase-like enzyme/Ser/Thr protein kinase RdoA (MazF antagonist)
MEDCHEVNLTGFKRNAGTLLAGALHIGPQALRTPSFRYESAVHAVFAGGELEQLVLEHYGIAGRVLPLAWLPTNTDRAYRVEATDGAAYVLRLSRMGESPALIGLQHRAIEHLAKCRPPFALPSLVPDRTGRDMVPLDHEGNRHYARLHDWVPGQPLGELPVMSRHLARQFGRAAGTVIAALHQLEHPAPDRVIEWDVLHGRAAVDAFLSFVGDAGQRDVIEHMIAGFDRRTGRALGELRQGVVHSDLTGNNVLFARTAEGLVVSGVIDFGDCIRSVLVGDVAAAVSTAFSGGGEPLDIACEIVTGAADAFPLHGEEMDCLFDLVSLRLAVGVSSLWQQRRMEPVIARLDDDLAIEWRALQALAAVEPEWATARFRVAAGLDGVGGAPRIRRWLATHADLIVAPVETGAPAEPLDLSPASEIVSDGAWRAHDRARAAIASAVEAYAASGATVLGRHDEARLIHSHAGGRKEPASVHFGLDSFAVAGTPVRSPLAGRLTAVEERRIVIEARAGDDPIHVRLAGLIPDAALALGAHVAAGEVLGRIAEPLPGSALPAHLHVAAAMMTRNGDVPAIVRPAERQAWRSLSLDPAVLMGLRSGAVTARDTTSEEAANRRDRSYAPSHEFYYRHPPLIVRGWMQYLYDNDARPLLDMINNVAHVGHCHPHVTEAIVGQTRRLSTNARYLYEPIAAFAEALAARFPNPLGTCFFCSSGSEANELALKIALTVSGRRGILGTQGNYHGNTLLLDAVAGEHQDVPAGTSVATIPIPTSSDPAEIDRCLDRVDGAIRDLASAGGVGAFITETVIGAGRRFPTGYLSAVAHKVREADGLVIVDEVQTGIGRAGEAFSAFELEGLVPDLVTIGKPIGNGYPLSSVVADRAVAKAFLARGSYFATFGGNPVACAAGLAVLEVIEAEGLMANAAGVGAYLQDRFEELAGSWPRIGDSYGIGLYRGLEIVSPATRLPDPAMALEICERLRELGVNCYPSFGHVLKIKPALSFSQAQADDFVDALATVLPGLADI